MENTTTTTATVVSPPSTSANTQRGDRTPRASFSQRRGGGNNDRNRGQGNRSRGRGGHRSGTTDENKRRAGAKPTAPKAGGMNTSTEESELASSLHLPQTKTEGDSTDDVEAEVCFICASPVIHNAVAPCNHRTCHICALRLRALYKTKACAHCRTNSDFVIFTDDTSKRYEDFGSDDFTKVEDNLGIKYEKSEIFEDTRLLLRYNCPDSGCDIACYGWPDLHRHVKGVHHKLMCDLCTRNKKVFTHEHELFTPSQLKQHEKNGDDLPGSTNQSGFKGHPECGFCRQRFYGDDELYAHCRDRHERCHICDRRGHSQQYYLDYNALEVHFKKDHFLCLDQECLEKKFIVFESEMDLKAHQLETHPNGLTKDARRDARRVDMSGFDYRSPHQENRQRRRAGGLGRGRDPNAEPLPVSSAQPMRRDEIAYQRQLAIHSAQSVSNRTFGGQLTSVSNHRSTAQQPASSSTSVSSQAISTNNTELPAIDSLNLSNSTTSTNQPMTAQDRARQLRHSAVVERASNLAGNSASKMATFRAKISSYKASSLTASELIDAFFALFDTSAAELGTLIKELAEIFETAGKRDELLKAWNDWRAINEDYPSLPGPDGLPAGEAGSGGKRILRLKNSTAQSSRSAANQKGSWGSSKGTPFPAISASSSMAPASANRIGQGKVGPVPWASSAASGSSRQTQTSTSSYSRPSSTMPEAIPSASMNRIDAFPALPAAQKPGMNVSRPGWAGNPVKRNEGSGRNTPVNAWKDSGSGSGSGSLAAAVEAAAEQQQEGATAGGKKKGKKKQLLVQWG